MRLIPTPPSSGIISATPSATVRMAPPRRRNPPGCHASTSATDGRSGLPT